MTRGLHGTARLLFPKLHGTWDYVNLNEMALLAQEALSDTAEHDERLVEMLHRQLGIDYSFGGYLEDREFLMLNKYQEPGCAWHLGVDFNVPLHTPVSMPLDGKLLYAFMDPDQDGGWGGKLIFDTAKGILILGHLDQIVTEIGTTYCRSAIVGRVADHTINGGWFPHLHVQRCRVYNPDVDGYSHWYPEMSQDFPDPAGLDDPPCVYCSMQAGHPGFNCPIHGGK